jgi:hypothetical protein
MITRFEGLRRFDVNGDSWLMFNTLRTVERDLERRLAPYRAAAGWSDGDSSYGVDIPRYANPLHFVWEFNA